MNVGSDIKMFDVRNLSSYLDDGWKDGFNITWTGFTNDNYNNTLLVKTNYNRSSNSLVSSGNEYTSVDTYSGFKFLYKPYSGEKLQWILIYIFVRTVDNGAGWFHYGCNVYDLVIDGRQMVSMPDVSYQSNTKPTLHTANGVGTYQSMTKQNGNNLIPGALIHLVDQGNVNAGQTQVLFYGTFTPQNYTAGTANQSFNVKFSYLNWAYMASCAGAKAIARNSTNWSSIGVSNWTITKFKEGSLSSTQSVKLTDSISVRTLSSDYASYGQTVTATGGKYVYLESSGSPNWNSGWQASPAEVSFIKNGDNNFPTKPRDAFAAKASFWDSTNRGGSWYAEKSYHLQYAPNVSGYKITQNNADSVSIKFSKHTATGQKGYFNTLYIRPASNVADSALTNDQKAYIEHDFVSQSGDVTITLTRSSDPAYVTITSSDSTDVIVNGTYYIGLDATTLLACCCYHNVSDGTGTVAKHASDIYISGKELSLAFGSGFSILEFKLLYPLDSAGITHVFRNRVPGTIGVGQFITDFCMYFETTDASSVGYAYVSVGSHSQRFLLGQTNRIKLKDVIVSSGAQSLVLKITNSTDDGSSETAPASKVIATQSIELSISTEDYYTTNLREDQLIDHNVYKDVVLPYLSATISNYQVVYPLWKNIFKPGSKYVWDVNYLDILQNKLITLSLREVVERMIFFYQEMQGSELYTYWLGNHRMQEQILKLPDIDNFLFDRTHVELMSSTTVDDVTYNRWSLISEYGGDIEETEYQPSLINTRYQLINQKVQFIKNDRYRLLPQTGENDLIEVVSDYEKDGDTMVIFNWYPSVIMYMLQEVF